MSLLRRMHRSLVTRLRRSGPGEHRSSRAGALIIAGLAGTMVLVSGAVAEKATYQEMERVCRNWTAYIVVQKGSWAGETDPRITGVQDVTVNDTLLARSFSLSPMGHVLVPVLKEMPPVLVTSEESDLDMSKTGGMAQLVRDVLIDRARLFVSTYGSLDAVQPSTGTVLFDGVNRQQWDRYLQDQDQFEAQMRGEALAPMTQVGPLLTTSWDQGAPYNNFCPIGYGGNRTLVGCVATAASQLMAYHQWPPCGYDSGYYVWDGDNSCTGNTPAQILYGVYADSYDWANMPDNCHSGCTPEQAAAAAELCYEVGVAYWMDYGVCGSGAYTADALNVFPGHFRYSDQIDREDRTGHTSPSWFAIIQTEIDANRPMLYRIYTHAIVCDGWRDTGGINQYHMNYGWDDGFTTWYSLDNLFCNWEGCSLDEEYLIRYIMPDSGVMLEADTTFGWAPFEVNFQGMSSHSVGSWMWEFGDGEGDTVVVDTINYVYTTPGVFDVFLAVDTGGDTLSIKRPDYVIVLADTLVAQDVLGTRSSTVDVTVYARNATPLDRLIIPFEFSGTLSTQYVEFTTDSCRTDYFETQNYSHYDPGNGKCVIRLETTSSSLPSGVGPVVKLRFNIPYMGTEGLEDTVVLDGYGSYLPEFSGSFATYQPENVAGIISATCCLNYRGNVDNSYLDDINVADVTYLVDFLFAGGPAPECTTEANVDGITGPAGPIDVSDLVYLVDYIFASGPQPPGCL